MKNYLVYRTWYKQKFYYGVHNGSDKNYKGSGKRILAIINKHGSSVLRKEDLFTGLTREEAYELEHLIVDSKMLKDPNCLNLKHGGEGGSVRGAPRKYSERPSRHKLINQLHPITREIIAVHKHASSTGYRRHEILRALRGEFAFAGGYAWEYTDETMRFEPKTSFRMNMLKKWWDKDFKVHVSEKREKE